MAAMGQTWVEMKTGRVETGWFYAAPAVLNSLEKVAKVDSRVLVFDQETVAWSERDKITKVVFSGADAWMTDNLPEALRLTK
jgi:hypothetical protein